MSFLLKFMKLSFVLKVCAAVGYGIALAASISSISSIPFPLIGLGIFVLEFLPFFRNRAFQLVYFWVLYAMLAYTLVSYHEFNVCLLDSCSGSEFTSILTAGSTGILWASIDISSKKKIVSQVANPGFLSNYKADERISLRWV
tara:strand:+ start:567 stop:995 length:429 start_codon:yes stop_codon:yes gene_type:complete